jgi:hypothetical protein
MALAARFRVWDGSIYAFCQKEELSFSALNKILNESQKLRAEELREHGLADLEARLKSEREIFGTQSQVLTVEVK